MHFIQNKGVTPAKGQMTLCFSKGKMGIENNAQNSQIPSETPSKTEKVEEVKNTADTGLFKKRKMEEISKDEEPTEEVIQTKSKRKPKVIDDDEIDNEVIATPKADDITKAECDGTYKDVSKCKELNDMSYDPIKDAPYYRHQHVPMSLVAHACEKIEK